MVGELHCWLKIKFQGCFSNLKQSLDWFSPNTVMEQLFLLILQSFDVIGCEITCKLILETCKMSHMFLSCSNQSNQIGSEVHFQSNRTPLGLICELGCQSEEEIKP